MIFPFNSDEISRGKNAADGTSKELQAAPDLSGSIERQVLPVIPRFFDRLTMEQLPEELVIQWLSEDAKESMPVSSGILADLLSARKGSWLIRQGDREIGTFPLKKTYSAEKNGYLIPYRGIVEADLKGMRDGDFAQLACQGSPLQEDIYQLAQGDEEHNLLDSVYENGTPAYTLRRYLRFDGPEDWQAVTKIVEDDRKFFRWVGPAKGLMAFKLESETYGEKVQIVQPIAGEVQHVHFTLHRGPRLRGTLRNQDGEPMPHQTLRALVEIGPDGDWGDTPGRFAVAVGGSPGNWHRCAQGSLKTDGKGEFSIEMPLGTRYAMEYGGIDSYGFTESLPFPNPPDGDVILDVIAIDFSSGYQVKILNAEGNPMSNIFVRPIVASDYPWFRQFTGVPVDEQGIAYLPGIHSGSERVRIIVQTTKDWSDGEMLARFPFNGPLPSPPLELVVEDSAD